MRVSRRRFLQSAAALTAAAFARVRGSNEDLRIAVIGLNGRGRDHVAGFRRLKGVRVVALCDVDRRVLDRESRAFGEKGGTAATVTDARKLFDDPGIDAVAIATPNHWHALLGIWACQAGKDVYVEKPVSHNVREGRRLVEAAAKHGRIVQAGMQSRSNPGMRELMAFIHEGRLGRVTLARGLCYKRRKSIGQAGAETPVPESVDYDLWCGPAPLAALRRKNLHYDWHWVWPTGNGDLGNQGVHQVDLARWALRAEALSPRVLSFGGRLGYADDGETPNTQVVVHDYAGAPLVFEVRGLPKTADTEDMDTLHGAQIGVIVECEQGRVVIPAYEGGAAFDKDGTKIQEWKGAGDHYQNFVDAVRARDPGLLAAPILDGHLSSALCHTGNLSYRLGRATPQKDLEKALAGNAAAKECLGRLEPHLAAHGIDLSKTPLTLGAVLEMDPRTETCPGNAAANAGLTRDYRKPFVVPEAM